MSQKIIRMTEQDLRSVVTESVKRYLNEASEDTKRRAAIKKKAIRELYRIIEPFTHLRYTDDNWQHIWAMIDALENAGFDVSVGVEDGGYRNSEGGNTLFGTKSDTAYWKEWQLTIPVEDVLIKGCLKAHFCGTQEDPFSAYDVTCTFWPAQKSEV